MNTLDALKTGQLNGQKRIDLACGLTEFPLEILELADSLEILDLSNNNLSTLPPELTQLKKLKVAFFNNNQFEEFPIALADCPQLSMVSFKGNKIKAISETALSTNIRWLILTNNQLTTLPASIGNLHKLQKLMLAGNQLHTLPKELVNCTSLELIRLAANELTNLPDWLFALPRLSWLAYAGNPCSTSEPPEGNTPLASIHPADLEMGQVLGQGASGVIYKGLWTPDNTPPQTVAIKLFKGDITSDGLPLDEMQACITAGSHPNLVNVLGKLSQPIDGKTGLVFSFIAPDYDNLGGPPSLESCTRDTYNDKTRFTLPAILNITQGIAAATKHLHSQGIMHGDLYAHNILVNNQGESILGDFGAASIYDSTDKVTGQALEQLEARAFGCLLEDLLDRHITNVSTENETIALQRLRHLQRQCMESTPAIRPTFTIINKLLSEVSTLV